MGERLATDGRKESLHRRVEAHLGATAVDEAMDVEEVKVLLRELQLRQVELERQNEELRRAQLEQQRSAEALRESEAKLRTLFSQLITSEDRDRRRLATELHDDIGQILAWLSMTLDTAVETRSPTVLAEARVACTELSRRVRALAFELSPPILYQLGLAPALDWLAEDVANRFQTKVSVVGDGEEIPLSAEGRTRIFASVRELLLNAVEHAKTDRVNVSVERHGSQVRIVVEENGVGFDPLAGDLGFTPTRGFGLFAVRERIEGIGGSFEVISSPGRGTRATLTAPLELGSECDPDQPVRK